MVISKKDCYHLVGWPEDKQKNKKKENKKAKVDNAKQNHGL